MEHYLASSIQLSSSAPKHTASASRLRKIGRMYVQRFSARCSKIAWTPAATRKAKRSDATNATRLARIFRQNESREASLDYIINNEGVIEDAVGTQKWSGEAAIRVSIVNWVKA